MLKKIKYHVLNEKFLYCLFLFLFCIMVNYSFDYILKIIYALALFVILILLKDTLKYIYSLFIVFLSVLGSLYFPIGQIFGSPSYNTVLSVFSTNYLEAKEFLFSIPVFYYLSSLLILILAGILLIKKDIILPLKGKKWLFIFAMATCLHGPIKSMFSGEGFHLYKTGLPPIKFMIDFYRSIEKFKKDHRKTISALNNDTWGNVSSNPDYSNYILVIGESVRKDFMHTYGFQIKNTPFSDQAQGIFFKNYLSAASSTQMSLMNTLALRENDELQLQNNIISLANKAGFKTYWFSNQGSRGTDDTAMANFARKAQVRQFLKPGSWSVNYSGSDEKLLPFIESALNNEDSKPKLIIVHLMGSHPPVCKRTQDQFDVYFRSKDLSCYIQTIKDTDTVLKKITKIANEKKDKWSMMYFSDHGLALKMQNNLDSQLHHSNKYKQNFEVPMFIISSDATQRTEITAHRSAFSFLSLFSEWTGIKTEKIPENCHFLSNTVCKNQTSVMLWNQKTVDIKDLPSDPG
ncbi:phosphoethanolamine transferase [Candidatus Williamhamiltonella defendens]|uniref:Sulfatase N-terminal domain-containing protein n=1 Tax=Candidatus Williamhamiltonella defendens TaxID=138072 RepID=A0A2D3TBB4_9ENTR|nr:phosphoethanolamine transferase [Candidatus Hamiltonella defensa]ATW33100.1 hypothetical protein BJP43_01085 [Candidatus Hamiltonella defensa]